MKNKTLLFISALVLLSLSVTGCTAIKNTAGNLAPEAFIPDLTQEGVEAFILEVVENMEGDTHYKMSVSGVDGQVFFLIDGENSMMNSTAEGEEFLSYTVDNTTYIKSGNQWMKYSSNPSTDESSLIDSDLFKEEIKNITYLQKEECPESQGTCYSFEVKEGDQTGKLFVNAVSKLPVTYEYIVEGQTTTVIYDFETVDKVSLPEEAKNAVSF